MFVVDQLFSLLKARRRYFAHPDIWKWLTNPAFVTVLHSSRSDFESAYAIYDKFSDKNWSFTDCLSYHCIRTLKIKTALSLDRHFREFGIVTVLP